MGSIRLMAKRRTISDQLRKAIDKAPISRYRIAREIDCTEALLCRFMGGQCGLSLDKVEKIAALLGLEFVARTTKGRR